MAYTKLGWVNDRAPALNQTNLNHMDQGIYDAHQKLSEYEDIFTGDVDESVQNWLDEHPEATTTVQDNSITSIKLNRASVPFYNVQDYGILPDRGDIYSELYDLLATYVYYTGGIVYFPKGKYTVSYTVCIPENTTFIGDGPESEIYFNEYDDTFGTTITNAGSNVSIKNMKISQASTGTFHTGAQPGCIGFSDNAKEQAIAGKYAHTFARAEVQNLLVENVTFSGFYPLQTENDTQYPIRNVIYRNVYCPDGCVSVMASSAGIENVLIENVTCDLFRITVNSDSGKLSNIVINNVICQTPVFSNPDLSSPPIIVNNLVQTTNTRYNDVVASVYNSGVINANIIFNGCIFNAISTEVNGIDLYRGVRTYKSCTFNYYNRCFLREVGVSDSTNYEIAHDCTFNEIGLSATNDTILLGYGRNNTYNATRIKSFLWGDIHMSRIGVFDYANAVTGQHTTEFRVDDDKVYLSAYLVIANTNRLMDLKTAAAKLPFSDTPILITLWNASSRSDAVNSFAKFDGVTLKCAEPTYSSSTGFDRVLIEAPIYLDHTPTITELAGFFLLA